MARRRLGLEIIDFQHDDTGSQLEVIFQKMVDELTFNPKYILEGSEHDMRLCNYVKKRFGIPLDMHYGTTPNKLFSRGSYYFVYPVCVSPFNILGIDAASGAYRHEVEKVVTKNLANQKGTVDLKRAKVSGIFSEISISIFFHIPAAIKIEKLSIREIVATFLHELGHAFTFYEFSDRLSTNNQILMHLSQALKTNDKKEMTYVFKELATRNGLDEKTFLEFVDSENRVMAGYYFFVRYIGAVIPSIANSRYDETATEQLADNFASKFGYGLELVTGLDKAYQGEPENNDFVMTMLYFLEMLEVIRTIETVFKLVNFSQENLTPLTVFGYLVDIVTTFFIVLSTYKRTQRAGDTYRHMEYDDLKDRYKRVRMQYIDVLKYGDIPAENKKRAIDAIKQLDEIIDRTRNFKTLKTIVSNWIFTKNRNTKADIELQKMLEQLAHNDLFLKSSELSTI